jgi:oligoribonuclease
MQKILWLDMEMTGLDVTKEVPIEVAAIVTDLEFKELETYHSVIQQPQQFLDRMDDWNKSHHGASGLTALVPNGRAPDLVEQDLVFLLNRHFPEPAVLAGNSIAQDRAFLNSHMPKLASKLHYRMLDVTAWKIIMNARFQLKYEKKNTHRALDDIRESIAEMAYYTSHIQKNPSRA